MSLYVDMQCGKCGHRWQKPRMAQGNCPSCNPNPQQFEWPAHKASLHLTHNQHLAYYRTVQESIDDEDHGYSDDCWVSPEQKQKAIETNECWSLQWYPETPVGFCQLSAADLDVLLEAARAA